MELFLKRLSSRKFRNGKSYLWSNYIIDSNWQNRQHKTYKIICMSTIKINSKVLGEENKLLSKLTKMCNNRRTAVKITILVGMLRTRWIQFVWDNVAAILLPIFSIHRSPQSPPPKSRSSPQRHCLQHDISNTEKCFLLCFLCHQLTRHISGWGFWNVMQTHRNEVPKCT
jgi:hypothetical protein